MRGERGLWPTGVSALREKIGFTDLLTIHRVSEAGCGVHEVSDKHNSKFPPLMIDPAHSSGEASTLRNLCR